ncbi:gas vesicle protein K [Nocardioides sp. KC13]|uniref:Gas vesicle protein K n=1 Tax=Nocardioides turkmenicus TaxID=2711220 RepID=A0A6M1R9Q9_9ACTN|nr:gas vesicle protein K [Nocardioides sp. KC13]NGN95341.1 gas vesicle protein K [Nocardioides sp. KC13]
MCSGAQTSPLTALAPRHVAQSVGRRYVPLPKGYLRGYVGGWRTTDPESVEKGLVQLVLTLVELLRQLMERQAIRRMDAGGLSDDDIERLGQTLMLLDEKMTELRDHFGLTPEDLNIDLGPLGKLL